MTSRATAYALLFATIGLTVYGQLIFKWRMQQVGELPPSALAKTKALLWLLLDPAIFSGLFAAFAASLCWMVVLTRLPLSEAYPLTALTFVLVVMCSWLAFNEQVGPWQWVGLSLIVGGLIVGSQR